MNLVFFIVLIMISFIVVRIGGVAFELTGLEWSVSKFQALSCFTATGFTTREAELITRNPQRRRIASYLMILGHAGLVTLIATFANSLHQAKHWHIPLFNLAIMGVSIFIFNLILSHSKLGQKITTGIKKFLLKKEIVKPIYFQELMTTPDGSGIACLEINKKSSIYQKTIAQLKETIPDLNILTIIREGKWSNNPPEDTQILLTDSVILFGKINSIKNKIFKQKPKKKNKKTK